MNHIYYVLYDKATMFPRGISGEPFDDIPDGWDIAKVHNDDGESFILHHRDFYDYYVTITNGYAEFISKEIDLIRNKQVIEKNVKSSARKLNSGNIVRDLNHQTIFFDYIQIPYIIDNNKLMLTLDVDSLPNGPRGKFNNLIMESTGKCKLYITKYLDPFSILSSHWIDLYKLKQEKLIELDIIETNNISVWASRENQVAFG